MIQSSVPPTETPDLIALMAGLNADAVTRRAGFGLAARRAALRSLSAAIMRNRPAILAAVHADQGKAGAEVDLVEIMTTLSEISHARRHLGRWMRGRRVWPTALMFGTSARVQPQAKGVVLVIAPWNFPVFLALGPVVSAIAAGNSVVLKPSEMTPATSAMLVHLCAEAFADGLVTVIEGGAQMAQALLAQPFDHIFFTGSPGVGKVVMAAAAQHLTPVTLELGGKSPVIVGPDADIANTARWLAWGKGMNAGQICVAPDHVFVPRAMMEPLAAAITVQMARFYGPDAGASSDLSQIVNARHFNRLNALLQDAAEKGAEIRAMGTDAPARNLMAPRLVLGTNEAMTMSQDEIFGPLLPLIPYDDLDAPIARINAAPKPLILYIFAKDRAVIDRIGAQTQSGAIGVNLTVMPFIHANFGFGGVGNSGMGAGHGRAGFDTFSHLKPVMTNQFTLLTLLFPPYGARVKRLVGLLLAYLR